MKYLLIWQTIPEETSAYVFDSESDQEVVAAARKAHGTIINNSDDDAPAQDINVMLENYQPVWSDASNCFDALGGPFEEVFVSGFMM